MQQKPRFSGGIIIAIVLVLALVMVTMYSSLSGSEPSTMAYSDVIEYFENNQVTAFELDLNTGTIELSLKEGDKPLPENALPPASPPAFCRSWPAPTRITAPRTAVPCWPPTACLISTFS